MTETHYLADILILLAAAIVMVPVFQRMGLGAVLGYLIWTQTFPEVQLWLAFAVAFAFFDWRTVEVNDRMFMSPTVMVALTAAVAFGPGTAALGVAAMAARRTAARAILDGVAGGPATCSAIRPEPCFSQISHMSRSSLVE